MNKYLGIIGQINLTASHNHTNTTSTSGLSHNVEGSKISKADWFALAGIAAVDFTRDLYQPNRRVCMPDIMRASSLTQFVAPLFT